MTKWLGIFALLVPAAANVADGQRGEVSPMAKVVAMLGGLRDTLRSEAEAEATTYEAFACFCQSTLASKLQEIDAAEGHRTTLEADLAAAASARDGADMTVAEKVQAIGVLQGEIEGLTADRQEKLLEYERAEVDLTAAVQALEGALQAMKASQTATSFVELPPAVVGTTQRAWRLAQSLGMTGEIQDVSGVLAGMQLGHAARGGHLVRRRQAPAYEFRGGDIIATLEDLKTTFKQKKNDLDEQESSDRQVFDGLVQGKEATIRDHQADIDAAQGTKAAEAGKVVTMSKDLTSLVAQLKDDKAFATELSGKCQEKAQLWDERSQARANELTALTQALTILETLQPASSASGTLAQLGSESVRHRPGGPGRSQSRRAGERRAAPPRRVRGPRRASPGSARALGRRSEVVALLRGRAAEAHSVVLLQLARRAAEDPFAKVKVMIQGLIEKLLKEAAEEANHKGWCDREVGLAEQSRDLRARDIEKLNAELAFSESHEGDLAATVQALEVGMAQLNESIANSTSLRREEAAEHNATIQEARVGQETVQQAITVLQAYYRSGQPGESTLLQRGRARGAHRSLHRSLPEAPDAGFSGAYEGAQGGIQGVFGLLEVLRSDFEATVRETEEAEEAAVKSFSELDTVLRASLAEKEAAHAERSTALQAATVERGNQTQALSSQQGLLDGALGELEALRSACFGGGESPEEKKLRREQEIQALQQTLCLLGQPGTGSTVTC